MKTLKAVLNESLLDDIDVTMQQGTVYVRYINSCKSIIEFIEANYILRNKGHKNISDMFIIHEKPDSDGKYLVDSKESIILKDSSLTTLEHDLFKWNVVDGDFGCINCNKLKSLKGAPIDVKSDIQIKGCNLLESLEGFPKKCGYSIWIQNCNSLKSLNDICKAKHSYEILNCESLESLEGFPVNSTPGNLSLCECGLKTLKGAPVTVGGTFNIRGCKNLLSLDNFPTTVRGSVYAGNCGGRFTEEDIRAVSNVKRKVYADKYK